MNKRDRNGAITDTGKKNLSKKKEAYFLKCHAATPPKDVLDYKSCPMWSSNCVFYLSIFWDVTPCTNISEVHPLNKGSRTLLKTSMFLPDYTALHLSNLQNHCCKKLKSKLVNENIIILTNECTD